MRRYAGSNLYQSTGLDFMQAEWLLVHKRKGQDRKYYNKKTHMLRARYIKALADLSINWREKEEMAYKTTDDRIKQMEIKLRRYEAQAMEHGLEFYMKAPENISQFPKEYREAMENQIDKDKKTFEK